MVSYFNFRERLVQTRELYKWKKRGATGPPPHRVKQDILRSMARTHGVKVLVETGTYRGAMVAALRDDFDRIYSIELDSDLHRQAQRRFVGDHKVKLLLGDAEEVLPRLLEDLREPALFWLDGHYSGGGTARGAADSPISSELRAVLEHGIRDHVVLIDDARYFTGRNGYPTIEELQQTVNSVRSDLQVSVEQDVIRIEPHPSRNAADLSKAAQDLRAGRGPGSIQWILFSKNRTLQAKAALMSLHHFGGVSFSDVTVLYVDSPEIPYEQLKAEVQATFRRQYAFLADVREIVRSCDKDFIVFLVDDGVFRERFDPLQIVALMREYPDLDAFSLRLGKNIEDGMPPAFEPLADDVISWKTQPGLGRTWNYFWELTSTVYRRELVLDFLDRLDPREITFPNPLESRYYDLAPNHLPYKNRLKRMLYLPRRLGWQVFRPQERTKRMACYTKSKLMTQPVNLVATLDRNSYATLISPEELHGLFLQGYSVDFECLHDVPIRKPNGGFRFFRLRSPAGQIHERSLYK